MYTWLADRVWLMKWANGNRNPDTPMNIICNIYVSSFLLLLPVFNEFNASHSAPWSTKPTTHMYAGCPLVLLFQFSPISTSHLLGFLPRGLLVLFPFCLPFHTSNGKYSHETLGSAECCFCTEVKRTGWEESVV